MFNTLTSTAVYYRLYIPDHSQCNRYHTVKITINHYMLLQS